jgi:hypothetical protein
MAQVMIAAPELNGSAALALRDVVQTGSEIA